jgi:peptidyl-prolyl cis-trans isomerase A (cyclophilin A)
MRTTTKTLLVLATALAVTAATAAPAQGTAKEKLMNPAALNETAPETFRAKFETSKGDFVVEVTRAWAPNGADRFYNLVKNGYYDEVRFFRVLGGANPFMAQFGIHGDPAVSAVWRGARIPDDPVKGSNTRGMVTFATAGPNTRTTQLFVNYKDNSFLDGQGFSPFGKVIEGMDVVDNLHAGYGEGAPRGAGPDQNKLQSEGNAYLVKEFPKLDHIKKATLLAGDSKKSAAPKPAKSTDAKPKE